MNAKEFIEHLQKLISHGMSETVIVKAYDPEEDKYVPITGALYGEEDLEIHTDE